MEWMNGMDEWNGMVGMDGWNAMVGMDGWNAMVEMDGWNTIKYTYLGIRNITWRKRGIAVSRSTSSRYDIFKLKSETKRRDKSRTRNINEIKDTVHFINHKIIAMRAGDVWQGAGDHWL